MSTKDSTLTKEYLQSIFYYKDGELYWKNTINSRAIKDCVAGHVNSRGYKYITLNKQRYLAHRLIFILFNNYIPNFIDHIDNNKLNNKIENLRNCTNTQNQYNSKLSKINKSGIKNVYWNKRDKKWQVTLSVHGKQKSFGKYEDLELAELVAIEARDKFYGKFARHQ